MTDNSAPDAAVQIVMQDLRERGVIFADDAFFRAAVVALDHAPGRRPDHWGDVMHRIHLDVNELMCWDEWQHMQTIVREGGRDPSPPTEKEADMADTHVPDAAVRIAAAEIARNGVTEGSWELAQDVVIALTRGGWLHDPGRRAARQLIADLAEVGVVIGDMQQWRRDFLRGHVAGENEDHRLAGVIADQADELDVARARVAELEAAGEKLFARPSPVTYWPALAEFRAVLDDAGLTCENP